MVDFYFVSLLAMVVFSAIAMVAHEAIFAPKSETEKGLLRFPLPTAGSAAHQAVAAPEK